MSIDEEILTESGTAGAAATGETEIIKQGGPRFQIPEWVKAQSPDTPVEEYVNHPLNFAQSKGIGKTIRGFEGIMGGLRFALIDIVFGLLEYSRERKLKSE